MWMILIDPVKLSGLSCSVYFSKDVQAYGIPEVKK